MSEQRLPAIFRGTDAAHATVEARLWAAREGLRLRAIASVRLRGDMPPWADPAEGLLHPFEVVLVVDLPETGEMPEPPPTLWGDAMSTERLLLTSTVDGWVVEPFLPGHKTDRAKCPECGEVLDRIAVTKVAYTFESCDCEAAGHAHLVEQMWHREHIR